MKKSYTENYLNNRPPKVLMYYTYSDRIGGPLTYIHTIMDSELNKKYKFVTCFQNKAPGGLDIKLLMNMIANIRKEKPDIVHVQGVQSEGFYGVIAAKLAGCKNIVMTIHGLACDDINCRGIKKFIYQYFVEPFAIRLSDKVYCVCQYASQRKIIASNVRGRNFGYIHNSVSKLKVKCERNEIRKKYNISDEDVVFCICSRVTREKGFDLLQDIVKQINDRRIKHFKLLVLGDGDYYETFTETMKKEIAEEQIIMVGATKQVADYLAASDVFIFPSYRENLSIALLEAGISGLPCIVSNVGGNSEIIKDGQTGFVLEHFSSVDYVDKVQFLIDNPVFRKKMQTEIKEDIETRFSVKRMCKEIDHVYMSTK